MSQVLDIVKTRLVALQDPSRRPPLTYSILFYLAISIALLARLGSLSYITESLWHEDGDVFINQSYDLGLKSLWHPNDGYQHLYQRLVALLARQFPLLLTPYIFFLAWLYAFFLMIWKIRSRAKLVGLNNLSQLLLALAIALQPSEGEAFFNLTHAGFFLGIALALDICIPVQIAASATEMGFLALASLTGVTSVAMIPVLALQWVTRRDFSQRKAAYLIVPICALVQAGCMLASQRGSRLAIDTHFADWENAVGNFFSFGGAGYFIYCVAAAFWVVTLIYFLRWFRGRNSVGRGGVRFTPLFSAVAIAAWFLLVVMGGAFGDPGSFSPLDVGSRYFLLPYSLIFFIALTCTQDDKIPHATVAILLGVVCAITFVTVSRPDRDQSTGLLTHANMQWLAFASWQKVKPDLVIPINSPYPVYPPGSSVKISQLSATSHSNDGNKIKPILLSAPIRDSLEIQAGRENLNGQSAHKGPVLEFDITGHCAQKNYLALEIDLWRERLGSAQIYWGRPDEMSDEKSLERFYPAGAVTMQFAFHREASDRVIRLFPALGVPDSALVRVIDQYIKPWPDSGIVIGEPTPAGGQVKINEVRLFCLE
jgi:hypothetical protein